MHRDVYLAEPFVSIGEKYGVSICCSGCAAGLPTRPGTRKCSQYSTVQDGVNTEERSVQDEICYYSICAYVVGEYGWGIIKYYKAKPSC